MDGGSHGVKVIRVNMGACASGVTAERDNRSEANVHRGIKRMLLTHMGKGEVGRMSEVRWGLVLFLSMAGNLVELPC